MAGLQWLFEARKRHGLSVLNYTATFNYIHTKEKRGIKAEGRDVLGADDSCAPRESPMLYKTILWQENDGVRP
jgi:hypothetical protein